jgi:tryptophan synthase alpha chain
MNIGIYYTLGDGGIEQSLKIFEAALEGGAKLLEVGLPFSDPLLDGPVIQQSHTRALSNGEFDWADICKALGTLVTLAKAYDAQVSLMGSVQLLFSQDHRNQLPKVDGILVTDIKATLPSPISLPSPRVWFVSGELACREGLQVPEGDEFSMIYLTRVQGVTGASQQEDPITTRAISQLKKISALPIWLGFGISTAADVKKAKEQGAHGAIIGSAFVKVVQDSKNEERYANAKEFVSRILKSDDCG